MSSAIVYAYLLLEIGANFIPSRGGSYYTPSIKVNAIYDNSEDCKSVQEASTIIANTNKKNLTYVCAPVAKDKHTTIRK